MLISSDETGGQIVSRGADPRFYDDIGCLAADAAGAGDERVHVYVRTAAGTWADAARAAYARPAGAHTPMASGIVAFDTIEAAAATGSAVLSWDDVLALETAEARR